MGIHDANMAIFRGVADVCDPIYKYLMDKLKLID
jgi:hypothetical protein